MRAFINLRYGVPERRSAFLKGLSRLGYVPVDGFPKDNIREGDLLVTWNRIGAGNTWAKKFQKTGLPVIVTENSSWGNTFAGQRWYHMASSFHNTAGRFPIGSPDRWKGLNVSLQPWRTTGDTIILPQRGIGSSPTKMPFSFTNEARRNHKGRIRKHPGQRKVAPLKDDLEGCQEAITWGSGAAIIALTLGVRVISYMPNWIGEQDNTDEGRLAMFERLAWAQWTLDEIATGKPFARLLGR